ncbi:MAG TPA: CDP-paratose 2-epimerase [Candidatus Margulisbacteria bacterium]|nr:MAG: hypothetical protein A2X43_05445 [Candidatus Margulisbacteria bacterium GWD2_39_127]OGI04357.1 MAG: hypothetical protein A2X42_07125 [Candidatus Margulisbacteria bacterium GWF2_38_17]OGI07787.1 MAG: hypothetical protein A2X41_07845 [Candidatus Margulisbacteria bacterium GWE2_39_32]HAR63291.1 CDP-paratose 2-epimerase [Candidatus Margulisiibacteriota bacterium]HCT85210.1 CDP-paratose 2-epimerase [Candidatus Margulisiibacteriota bacterium]
MSKLLNIPKQHTPKPCTLITGGAGFIGINLSHRLLKSGKPILILDNLSNPYAEQNLKWLRALHGDTVQTLTADIRDRDSLHDAIQKCDEIFHLAAYVKLGKDLAEPMNAFEANCCGTLNILEELRSQSKPIPLYFASTKEIYGSLADIALRKNKTRYEPENIFFALNGISENRPLDLENPIACSKGTADQYIMAYSRKFNIPAIVFRLSTVYGYHQWYGNWVTQGIISTIAGIQEHGEWDFLQVTDLLFIDDLIDAFFLARTHISKMSGQAFNLGGGPDNTISVIEFLDLIQEMFHPHHPIIVTDTPRSRDQAYYATDYSHFNSNTGWHPKFDIKHGLERVYGWLLERRNEIPALINVRSATL